MQKNRWNSLLFAFTSWLAATVSWNAQAAAGPASITAQPTNRTVLQGTPTTFTVGVDGTAPFTYQWRKGAVAIAAATNQSYTIAATAPSDEASYSVAITNSLGDTASASAELLVDPGTLVTTALRLLTMTNVWKYDQSGEIGRAHV